MEYQEHRQALINYLLAKLAIEDFHAVRDCVIDLEVLDAEQKGYLKAQQEKNEAM
jgi:hypothetical protein